MSDIAADFRNIISQLPLGLLEEMKNNFVAKGNGSEAIKKVINDLNVEIQIRCVGGVCHE